MSLTDTSQHANCSAMSDVLNRIGDKWSVMVVGMLGRNGTLRFNELKRMINGVSQRMLTLTLRNLERDGFLTRAVTPSIPPRVDYALTPLGREVMEPLDVLARWALANSGRIVAARDRYDGSGGGT